MSTWSRATDLALLRKWVRFAIVGCVATVLTAQVLGIPLVSPAAGDNLCPQACAVSFQACSNFCIAANRVERAQCQLAGAICGLQCVLNGYSFGLALQQCQVLCMRDEQLCLAAAYTDNQNCNKVCNFQVQVCNLICTFLVP